MFRVGLRTSPLIAAAAFMGVLASCASAPPVPPNLPGSGPDAVPPAETGPIVYQSSGHAKMDAWRDDFSARMLAAGHDRAIVKSLLESISPIGMWLGNEVQAQTSVSDQAEFAKPIWDYLKVPLGETRISKGQEKLSELGPTLEALEAAYGVDRQTLLSIWGMETSYGAIIGNFDAPNALANMAVEGRRQSFAEGEIIALIKLIDRGDVERSDLIAGWAGAMGQTQFMPSTFLAYGQDFTGDGKKDVWTSEADALASAANYLAKSGYAKGEAWGVEVLIPAGFDYSMADGKERRLTTWQAAGLSPIKGGAFDVGGADFSELWLPAGAQGPKYLLFRNFKAFKKYNNADSYAFAVGMAGNAIVGNPGPVAAWPKHLMPLSVFDIKALQAGLNARGLDAGPVDGIPGRRTKTALQQFQKSQGIVADGYPTKEMLTLLQAANGGAGVAVSGAN